MYARLTTFRVKPDKMGDMLRWRQENEAAIYAQPGLREWIGLWDGSVALTRRATRYSTCRARPAYYGLCLTKLMQQSPRRRSGRCECSARLFRWGIRPAAGALDSR
jgi:hypothetical protein